MKALVPIVGAGVALGAMGLYEYFKGKGAAFQTHTVAGPNGVPVTVATPVGDSVTSPQSSGTVMTPPAAPGAQPVYTDQGTVYAQPGTVIPPAGAYEPTPYQNAPIVITPTGVSSTAIVSTLDVQRALNTLHMATPPLSEDGVLGPATIAAIQTFQGAAGLAVDGNAGPATKAALSNALAQLASSGSGSPSAVASAQNAGTLVGSSGLTLAQIQAQLNALQGSTTGQMAPVADPNAVNMTGAQVQHALNLLGAMPTLTEDGVLGPMSVAAIKSFQMTHGLTADGVAGPATKQALSIGLQAISGGTMKMPPVGDMTPTQGDPYGGKGLRVPILRAPISILPPVIATPDTAAYFPPNPFPYGITPIPPLTPASSVDDIAANQNLVMQMLNQYNAATGGTQAMPENTDRSTYTQNLPLVKSAVVAYQKKNGLNQDGQSVNIDKHLREVLWSLRICGTVAPQLVTVDQKTGRKTVSLHLPGKK